MKIEINYYFCDENKTIIENMKVDFLKLVAIFMLIAATCACINEQYDLSDIDTEMTVLPGLSIALENTDNKVVSITNNVVNNADRLVDKMDEGTVVIGKTTGSLAYTEKEPEELYQDAVIEIPGAIDINVSSFVGEVLPRATVYLPIRPVLEVDNPSTSAMLLTGEATCSGETVAFGPYEVPAGRSSVILEDPAILSFFAPVRGNLMISDLKLQVLSPVGPTTKADHYYTFSVQGYAPLSFEPGDEIQIEYPWDEDKLASYDIAKLADKYGVSVESCQVSIDVTNNIPVEITASASAKLNNGKASAHLMQPIAAGSVTSPRTTRVIADATIPEGASSVSEAVIYVTAKVNGNETVNITEDHTLSFQLVEAIFSSGITVKP